MWQHSGIMVFGWENGLSGTYSSYKTLIIGNGKQNNTPYEHPRFNLFEQIGLVCIPILLLISCIVHAYGCSQLIREQRRHWDLLANRQVGIGLATPTVLIPIA